MKKTVFIVAVLVIIAACSAVAIIEYNNHKVTLAASQTSQVEQAQQTMELHDAVNTKNLQLANDATALANKRRLQLCAVIKTTKVIYDPTLCQ